jgi:hypothetical protein
MGDSIPRDVGDLLSDKSIIFVRSNKGGGYRPRLKATPRAELQLCCSQAGGIQDGSLDLCVNGFRSYTYFT